MNENNPEITDILRLSKEKSSMREVLPRVAQFILKQAGESMNGIGQMAVSLDLDRKLVAGALIQLDEMGIIALRKNRLIIKDKEMLEKFIAISDPI